MPSVTFLIWQPGWSGGDGRQTEWALIHWIHPQIHMNAITWVIAAASRVCANRSSTSSHILTFQGGTQASPLPGSMPAACQIFNFTWCAFQFKTLICFKFLLYSECLRVINCAWVFIYLLNLNRTSEHLHVLVAGWSVSYTLFCLLAKVRLHWNFCHCWHLISSHCCLCKQSIWIFSEPVDTSTT